jgi:hypothetical protein
LRQPMRLRIFDVESQVIHLSARNATFLPFYRGSFACHEGASAAIRRLSLQFL